MVKGTFTNRSAAGLRRSAIAERIRLREEWSSLKGTDDENEPSVKTKKKLSRAFTKNLCNTKGQNKLASQNMTNDHCSRRNKENAQPQSTNETLRGVVALVEVGTGHRALALRAALMALGATVVPDWSPLVTHLIWSQGGCRDTRARARALACRVVSPLWVEACAASRRRISEKVFPSTARDSDLPSPATLCRLLKRAEKENWPVSEFMSDSEDEGRRDRLRISSETDENTTRESVDVADRVNTAPRRALPVSISPPPANAKSRRKLFTARLDGEEDSDTDNTRSGATKETAGKPNRLAEVPDRVKNVPERQKKTKKYNITQEQRRNLENAGQIARRLATGPRTLRNIEGTQTQRRKKCNVPKIVLSGMPISQYKAVFTAIQTLKGKIQKQVNHRTTHVLLGSCKEDQRNISNKPKTQEKANNKSPQQTNKSTIKTPIKPFSICNQCNSPEGIVMKMFECDNVEVADHCSNRTSASDKNVTIICSTVNRDPNVVDCDENVIGDVCNNQDISDLCEGITNDKRLRTLKTLLGAARGCRVLHAQWALDSLKEKKWLPHIGYEVTNLLKIAQKARVERSAIGKMNSKYAYNVFHGMRVCVTMTADQRHAAVQLLSLCGAEVVNNDNVERYRVNQNANTQNNGRTNQHGDFTQNDGFTQEGARGNCDIVIVGKADQEVSSKWVFDSVAAGRPRTTRRYINNNIITLQ